MRPRPIPLAFKIGQHYKLGRRVLVLVQSAGVDVAQVSRTWYERLTRCGWDTQQAAGGVLALQLAYLWEDPDDALDTPAPDLLPDLDGDALLEAAQAALNELTALADVRSQRRWGYTLADVLAVVHRAASGLGPERAAEEPDPGEAQPPPPPSGTASTP